MIRYAGLLTVGVAAALGAQTPHVPTLPPVLMASHLQPGITPYRLVPDGRTQPDTTAWTVERRVLDRPRDALALQIMVARSHGETTVDSVLFDRRTLIPLWEHEHGPVSVAVDFTGSRIVGRMSRGPRSRPQTIDVRTPGFAYSSTMDNFVIQSLPLGPGYRAVLPFWDGDRLEMNTVYAATRSANPLDGRAAQRWLVEFVQPYAVETLWIDRATRRIVRHTYHYAREGTRSIVITGPTRP